MPLTAGAWVPRRFRPGQGAGATGDRAALHATSALEGQVSPRSGPSPSAERRRVWEGVGARGGRLVSGTGDGAPAPGTCAPRAPPRTAVASTFYAPHRKGGFDKGSSQCRGFVVVSGRPESSPRPQGLLTTKSSPWQVRGVVGSVTTWTSRTSAVNSDARVSVNRPPSWSAGGDSPFLRQDFNTRSSGTRRHPEARHSGPVPARPQPPARNRSTDSAGGPS